MIALKPVDFFSEKVGSTQQGARITRAELGGGLLPVRRSEQQLFLHVIPKSMENFLQKPENCMVKELHGEVACSFSMRDSLWHTQTFHLACCAWGGSEAKLCCCSGWIPAKAETPHFSLVMGLRLYSCVLILCSCYAAEHCNKAKTGPTGQCSEPAQSEVTYVLMHVHSHICNVPVGHLLFGRWSREYLQSFTTGWFLAAPAGFWYGFLDV